jgi:23S rRNA maturation-related 3'-5' exoribonuclease YhaM
VPYPAVRNLLVQKYLGEKRAHWMTALQEYDMEIKPANIVKGKGFANLFREIKIHKKMKRDGIMRCP